MKYLTAKEAAAALDVSIRHIQRLVAEADAGRHSRWRFGREIIDISLRGSAKRTLRFNLAALAPLAQQSLPGQ